MIVTATDPTSGASGSTTVAIVAAKLVSIVVTPANADIPVGARVQFTATATYDAGLVRDVTQYVSWSSSRTNLASIGNSPRRRGIATARGVGAVTITATDGATGVSGSTSLTITSATLVSIAITPTAPTIPDGTKIWFNASGMYSDGTTHDVTSLVSWSSSDTGVASISNATGNEGVATAKSVGTTTLTAVDSTSGKGASTTLTVSSATIVSIAITPANPSLFRGDTLQLVSTATMSDGTTMDVTLQVTWGTSVAGVATVSNAGTGKGIVTGVAAGTASITAAYPQTTIVGSTTVTVQP